MSCRPIRGVWAGTYEPTYSGGESRKVAGVSGGHSICGWKGRAASMHHAVPGMFAQCCQRGMGPERLRTPPKIEPHAMLRRRRKCRGTSQMTSAMTSTCPILSILTHTSSRQVPSFGLKTQEAAELRERCGQSSPGPNLHKLRRWLGGFRGFFARDRQAVRILNSDLLCLNVSTSSCTAPHR